jgi:hypothetical protein
LSVPLKPRIGRECQPLKAGMEITSAACNDAIGTTINRITPSRTRIGLS